jgi:hypothetical protein
MPGYILLLIAAGRLNAVSFFKKNFPSSLIFSVKGFPSVLVTSCSAAAPLLYIMCLSDTAGTRVQERIDKATLCKRRAGEI